MQHDFALRTVEKEMRYLPTILNESIKFENLLSDF